MNYLPDFTFMKDAKTLMGRRFTNAAIQKDMQFWPFKVIPDHDSRNGKKPMIVVTHKGEEKQFAPEEISSMVLHKMKEIAEAYPGTESGMLSSLLLLTSLIPNAAQLKMQGSLQGPMS